MIKSKSMLTEECHLNEYLTEHGVDVVDTDLGERIVQLARRAAEPYRTARYSPQKGGCGRNVPPAPGYRKRQQRPPIPDRSRPPAPAREVRDRARRPLRASTLPLPKRASLWYAPTKATPTWARTWPMYTLPAWALKKLFPQRKHLGVFLRLLARSATGQPITTYSSHFKKPRAGQQMHIVIVDNGRSRQLGRRGFSQFAEVHPLRGLHEHLPGVPA